MLFTLDKLIYKLVKQFQALLADELGQVMKLAPSPSLPSLPLSLASLGHCMSKTLRFSGMAGEFSIF